jgi:hypothetical protein
MKPILTNGGGQCVAFPDTCKTPTPGGPVPMPYPNIIQNTDGSGSGTVKILNKEVLRKGDQFRMSSGDEAGSIGGVISNRFKGKGEIKEGCDTVKAEGKDVAYLLVTVGQNEGSSDNVPKGAALKFGQLKSKLRSVRGKRRRAKVKPRKYKPADPIEVPPNTSVRDAASNMAGQSGQGLIEASEQLGEAGARSALRAVAEAMGETLTEVSSFAGSGVFDVVGICKSGLAIIIEAKGGGSALGFAEVDGVGLCQQGTPEYAEMIADKMAQSADAEVKAVGEGVKDAIEEGKVVYGEARTRYSGDPPKPSKTKFREFDP